MMVIRFAPRVTIERIFDLPRFITISVLHLDVASADNQRWAEARCFGPPAGLRNAIEP
jgi:hypothetical protein